MGCSQGNVGAMIEAHYVESSNGLLFAVKGLVHPPDAVVAYLRYAPDPEGERNRGETRYRRFYHFKQQEELLRKECPACLFWDPVFGAWLQGVPKDRIRLVYDPSWKLAELRRSEFLDELEERVVEFAALISERGGVPESSVGVSGSVLVGLHSPASDVDLVVYGTQHCRGIHTALQELLDEPTSEVRRLDDGEMRALYTSRSQDTPMSFQHFAALEGRKVNQGSFRGDEYFIRFVQAPAEIGEDYGDRKYTALGQATIEATVVDADKAMFTPCSYKVEDVRLMGPQLSLPLPVEVTSFRGRFCEQAREGERIFAKGKLERVVARGGDISYRLLLGGPGDYMTVDWG